MARSKSLCAKVCEKVCAELTAHLQHSAGIENLRSHAETAIKSHERERLEKLVRYMARPAISDERVIIEGPQSIRVKLKSRWTDGTESLLFTPSVFLERLVALIPAPKFSTPRAIMEFS